jgi:polysaccharide biosynthesis transport protein
VIDGDGRRRRPRWWLVAVLAGVGALVGLVVGVATPRTWTATATAFVASSSTGPVLLADGGEPAPRTGGWGAAEALESYARLATDPLVLRPVIRRLGLPMTPAGLARRMAVRTDGGASVLRIAATDGSPVRASAIADAVEARLAVAIGEVTPSSGTWSVRLTAVRPAIATPSSPGLPVDIAAGALAGALVGLLVAAAPALLRAARRRPPGGPAAPSMF